MMPSVQRLRDLSGQWNRWADDYGFNEVSRAVPVISHGKVSLRCFGAGLPECGSSVGIDRATDAARQEGG